MKRIEPGPGQESVWDYPRPPRSEPVSAHVRVEFGGEVIANSNRAVRVLETSHPPVYYIPPGDVRLELLQPAQRGASFCEWKGAAKYFDVVVGERRARGAAWAYPEPVRAFAEIAGYLAFYAEQMDACYVGDQRVQPQEGNFYGGWITPQIVGPFKGAPGTAGW
jgi:uncharacterized protein (DUF427 family)